MEITKDTWQEIASLKQLEFNSILGTRNWDEIGKDNLFLLKKKVGYAACGDPKEMPASQNYYLGYEADALSMINKIINIIIDNSEYDPIRFACTFLVVFWENAMSCVPVFRIVNNNNIFIDTNARVYSSWESFKTNNQLPKCLYCSPLDGTYNTNDPNWDLEFSMSPACSTLSQATFYADTAASVSAIAATIGSIVIASPIIMPVIGVTGAYATGRSIHTLYDRKTHQQSVGLSDRESRNAWFNIAGSALGAGTAAAFSKAKSIVESGKSLSKFAIFGIRVLNTSSLVFNGFGFVDSLILCKEKITSGTLTSLDVFHLSCEVLFFYNAIASIQATSNMLDQMSRINSLKESPAGLQLSKTQKRNLKRKVSKQKAKLVQSMNSNETCKGVVSGLLVSLMIKILNGFVPSAEEILYRYQAIGHDIKCFINSEISPELFMRSLFDKLLDLYTEIFEDLKYVINTIKNLNLKLTEYFNSASKNQRAQFCLSVQQLDNQVESIIRNMNEELVSLQDTEQNHDETTLRETNVVDSGDDDDESTDGGISAEMYNILNKTDKFLPYFTCDSLEDYQDILRSMETVLIDEFTNKCNEYKNVINAVKKSSSDFNVQNYNKELGIVGDIGQHFFNETVKNIDCVKLIRKIKYVHETKKCDYSHDTNILEGIGKMFQFCGPKGKGKISNIEILQTIVGKLDLVDIEPNKVDFKENCTNEHSILFIHPKELDGKDINKCIVVYYVIDNENTMSGIFILYE